MPRDLDVDGSILHNYSGEQVEVHGEFWINRIKKAVAKRIFST